MTIQSCRITIGREGELLRKITPMRVGLQFGAGTRIDGEFEIQPGWMDHAHFVNWVSNAFNSQDRLRLTIEFDEVGRTEGECWVVETHERFTRAIIGFKIVGVVEQKDGNVAAPVK